MIALSFACILVTQPKYITLIFATTECPISRRFTPEMKRIMRDFAKTSLFEYVYEDEGKTIAQVSKHHKSFGLTCPIKFEPHHALAREYKVISVPTVIVKTLSGTIKYQGRIDDSYGSDFKWHPTKQRDLRNALTALRMGKPVLVTKTTVIGCALNN